MYCQRCGAPIQENARFCTNCGTNTRNIVEKDTEIQFQVKPTYKIIYMLLPSFIIYSIPILILGGIVISLGDIYGIVIDIFGFIILLVYFGIKAVIQKKQYDNYTFNFYKTKVVYKDSFFNIYEKEIKYQYIREVVMQQTFEQSLFHIGNITLYTTAETGTDDIIYIKNIENTDEIYKQIKEIVEHGRN